MNKKKVSLFYLFARDNLFAIFVQNSNDPNADTMYYVQKDYLGSYYCITDETGSIAKNKQGEEQIYSFDPWGKPRNPQDWTLEKVPDGYLFDRGFTGHSLSRLTQEIGKHLWHFNLINLNGRLYDPMLGRMLQPDNYVSSATSLQNLNRYSYALNNPLKYIDPSGNNILPLIGTFNFSGIFTSGVHNLHLPSAGPSAHNYSYNWNTGQYEDFGPSGIRIVSFNEASNGFIAPNSSIALTGGTAQIVFSDIQGGMNLYIVTAFGRNTLVTAFGGLGSQYFSNDGAIGFSNPTASAFAGEANVFGKAGGGDLDWNTATDAQKIINVMNGIRDARLDGGEYIDVRQLFSNVPKYGSGVDLIAGIKINNHSMIVYFNMAIYKDMRIGIYPARMKQVGPFNRINVNGIIKEGYWDMMELNRAGGNIPMLMIEVNTNFNILYDYLYK